MRILLVKIIIFYIECTIFFANIEITLFILLTGLRTAKYIVPRGVLYVLDYFHNRTRLNRPVQQQQHIELAVFNEMRVLPMQIEDELTAKEYWHIVKDHLGKWHIGLVFEVVDSNGSIVLCADVLVSPVMFFQFPMSSAKQYLLEMADDDDDSVILAEDIQHNIFGSMTRLDTRDIYDLPDFPLIIETYWIRIIQRTWRRVYLERMRLLKLRGSIKAQRQFELSGNYEISAGNGMRGMLYPLMSGRQCQDANAM